MSTPRSQQDEPRLLHQWFLAGARSNPGGGALLLDNRTWSYDEVLDTAGRWATALLDAVPRPRAVGLLASHSEESYIGLLAALLSGAAVVPLNPGSPLSRNVSAAQRIGLDALVVDRAGLEQAVAVAEAVPLSTVLAPRAPRPAGCEVRHWITPGAGEPARASALPTPSRTGTAYVLFTSGSTGRPKGVPISHANIDHFLSVNHARYRLGHDDRVSQTFEQTFDVAMCNMFLAWGSGALLCPTARLDRLRPAEHVDATGITVWSSVPGVIAFAMAQGMLPRRCMEGLRWSLFSGEPLHREQAEAWQAAAPNSIVENLYGPTELTITCTSYRWDPATSPAHCVNGGVPIGRLSPGLDHFLLGESADAPEGELCVAGPQVFGGYLDHSDDAGRFLQLRGRRWYRTGDRVRWLPEAGLAFLGRVDDQVKIRGFRVEPGEVEAAFRSCHAVGEAVAVLPSPEEASLVLFYSGGDEVEEEAALSRLRDLLPEYMVPARIRRLPHLPRTAHGKIDRTRLRELCGDSAGPLDGSADDPHPPATGFDGLGELYESTFDLPWRRHLELPTVFALLGDLTGRAVLDIGSGSGRYCREAAERGASPVVGIEVSPGMAAYAVRYNSHPHVDYLLGSLPDELHGRFDVVLSVYVLGYLRERRQLAEMFRAAAAALRVGGRFIVVTLNPAYREEAGYYEPYGLAIRCPGGRSDGATATLDIRSGGRSATLSISYWTWETLAGELGSAGFSTITRHRHQHPSAGVDDPRTDYWQKYLQCPHTVVLECVRE